MRGDIHMQAINFNRLPSDLRQLVAKAAQIETDRSIQREFLEMLSDPTSEYPMIALGALSAKKLYPGDVVPYLRQEIERVVSLSPSDWENEKLVFLLNSAARYGENATSCAKFAWQVAEAPDAPRICKHAALDVLLSVAIEYRRMAATSDRLIASKDPELVAQGLFLMYGPPEL
jgi:hypothetical protein